MTPSEILVSAIENITQQSGPTQIDTWVKASSLFCEVSGSPLNDFIHAEELLNENGHSALEIISAIAAASFEWEQEKRAFASILRLTNLTGLTALRFTAAWLAFNMNNFEACISECEKIDDHGFHVYGLMGQAYLENGQPQQAINTLRIALAINEHDPAIWFQLAKAAFVIGNHDEAWQALESCTVVNGPGAEIVILQCAIACAGCESNPVEGAPRRSLALAAARAIFEHDANKSMLLVYAAKLALFAKNESCFIEEVSWFLGLEGKLDTALITVDVSEVLKALQKKGWYRGAAVLLAVLTGQAQTKTAAGPASA